MSPHSTSELNIERRPERRRRTLLGGRVTYQNGEQVFDFTIRNLSKGGAHITLPADQSIPQQVFLINMRDRLVYESIVV